MYRILRTLAVVAACGTLAAAAQTRAPVFQSAVDRAAQQSPDARIVVLDIATGRLLASHHLDKAARTLAAPGSTLKPLALYALVRAGRWS
ncbi:MAG: hypothetical protein ACRD3S_20120, partial [Terracidiphilus sp.]